MIIKIEVKDMNDEIIQLIITTNPLAHSLLSDYPYIKDEIVEEITKVLSTHVWLKE